MYRGPIHCFRTVLQKEGIAGIYRGVGAMLLRDVPGYCLYFIPYTFFCGWITPDGCISPNPSSVWLAGGVAGKHLFPHNTGKTRTGRVPGQMSGAGSGAAPFSCSPAADMGLSKHLPQGQAPWPQGCTLWLDRLYGSCAVSSSPGSVAVRRKPGGAAFSPDVAQQPKCLQKRTSTCWLPTRRVCTLPACCRNHRSAELTYWFSFPFSSLPHLLFFLCTPARKAGMCTPMLTRATPPVCSLPIYWPFLNCRSLNTEQFLGQVMIKQHFLCFSCK